MSDISGKQGKELLLAIIDELKNLDPRIVPFDSDEVQALEYGVAQGVRDVFGSGSPEYADFEAFRICAGNITRGDSRAEKQSKYELGLPRATARLEELIGLIDQSEVKIKAQDREKKKGDEPAVRTPPEKPAPPKAVPRNKPATPPLPPVSKPAPSPRATPAPTPKPPPREEPPPETGVKKTAARPSSQPGRVLLLQEGEKNINAAVKSLLSRIGIDIAVVSESGPSEVEGFMGLKNLAFAIMTVGSEVRGGLSGLTSVIGKPHTRHDSAFKLGLLVGSLGAGKVVILHSGDRPQDIPEGLFGIRYISYKEEGGWQIGLLKLLKANDFFIDANLLFD